ncbi:MAG: hypothetical protein DRG32_03280 [Deltaproteobacteria bacterium]|nr:MAG: hypothetical protein DRG32_03280 [Deltaproteobacteria bacterium]
MKRETLLNGLLIALLIAFFYLFYLIISPYFSILLWAVVLSIIFYPLNRLIRRVTKDRKGISALIVTVLVILIIVIPFGFFVQLLAKELLDAFDLLERFISEGGVEKIWEWIQNSPLFKRLSEHLMKQLNLTGADLEAILMENAHRLSLYIANQTSKSIRGVSSAVFQFALMSVALFYLLRDGEEIINKVKALLPFSRADSEKLLGKMVEMIQATIYGGIVVALVQGFLGGVGFWIVGLPSPIFWGAVMAAFSFLPIIGAFLIWIPASIILILQGSYLKGILLFGWGAVIVSSSDNILRPVLISGRTKVHALLLFFGVLGGLKAFGFLGFVLGPLIITVCLAMIEFYITPKRGASEEAATE